MAFLCSGCLAAVGLLAQEGTVGEATTKFGQFALGAFEVAGTVATSTGAPAKAASAVGEEILEVVEFATAAATKVTIRARGGAIPLWVAGRRIVVLSENALSVATPGGAEVRVSTKS